MKRRLLLGAIFAALLGISYAVSDFFDGPGAPRGFRLFGQANSFKCNPTAFLANVIDCSMAEINANNFGAKCDNSTNDAVAFQNAINQAVSLGAVLRFSGQCVISSGLTVSGTLSIKGNGISLSILRAASPLTLFSVSGAITVQMSDFQIAYGSFSTSNIAITQTLSSGISSGSLFENILFVNAGISIDFEATGTGSYLYTTIQNNWFGGGGTNSVGIKLNASTSVGAVGGDFAIYGNKCALSGLSTCLQIAAASGIRFVNNKCVGDNTVNSACVVLALEASPPAGVSDLMINDNSIENLDFGVLMLRSGTTGSFVNIQVQNNQFLGVSGGVGIYNIIDANGQWIDTLSVVGNIFYGPASGGYDCIDIYAAKNFTVANNVCKGNGGTPTGVNIGSSSSAGLVADNKFISLSTNITNASTTTVVKDTNGNIFTALPSAAANGSQIFVTDADPATGPCTHAGAQTGSTAFRQNGAWKCF